METLHYKHSRFVTQLPIGYRYSPSHYWVAEVENGLLRIGMTKFAVRMLGDMVDHSIETAAEAEVRPGQMLGWIEGFKAISDIFCVAQGNFVRSNPLLKNELQKVNRSPYREGWLYEVKGRADERCMDVHAYAKHLDGIIKLILEKEHAEEQA